MPETEAEAQPLAEAGHYSDPEAFAGFGEYVSGSRSIVFGSSVYKEVCGDLGIASTIQYKDGIPDEMASPNTLEPGTFGEIITKWTNEDQSSLCFDIFNPNDEPIPYEDCVIIGVNGEKDIVFSNGISYENVTPEAIIAILGDPYEIQGEYTKEATNAMFIWKDESGDHRLTMASYAGEVSNITYRDRSMGK